MSMNYSVLFRSIASWWQICRVLLRLSRITQLLQKRTLAPCLLIPSVNDHLLSCAHSQRLYFHDVQCSTIVPNDENWSACRLTHTCTHKTKGKWEFKAWQRKLGHWQSNNKAFFFSETLLRKKNPVVFVVQVQSWRQRCQPNKFTLEWQRSNIVFFFCCVRAG